MATIICNISALEYHRTPPQARDVILDAAFLSAETIPSIIRRPNINASQDVHAIHENVCASLKGISFPVHISNTEGRRTRTPVLKWHDLPKLKRRDLIPLAEGLFVTSPARTLLDLCYNRSRATIALLLMEFCGLYTVVPTIRPILEALSSISQSSYTSADNKRLAAYYGTKGNVLSFSDSNGRRLPWTACTSATNQPSMLWKRPPICTIDELIDLVAHVPSIKGADTLREAIAMSAPGSASPLETQIALLLGPSKRRGQEAVPRFFLNHQVPLPLDIAEILRTSVLVPDISWFSKGRKLVGSCEVDGAAHHDGQDDTRKRKFYGDSARRAALSHIGGSAITITYPQVANLESWDLVVDLIYRMLKLKRRKPTALFLKKREQLHREIFNEDIPRCEYEP